MTSNDYSGATVFNSGTQFNHCYQTAGALDIGFYPYYGNSPTNWPALIVRQPQSGDVFSKKEWSTAIAYYGGSMQEFNDVLASATVTGTRAGDGLGWTGLAAGASASIGNTDIPGVYGCGIITMTVQTYDGTATSFWKIKQRYYKNGVSCVLSSYVDEETVCDNIGVVTAPIMNLTGTFPNDQVQATVYGRPSGDGLNYSVHFEIEHVS